METYERQKLDYLEQIAANTERIADALEAQNRRSEEVREEMTQAVNNIANFTKPKIVEPS